MNGINSRICLILLIGLVLAVAPLTGGVATAQQGPSLPTMLARVGSAVVNVFVSIDDSADGNVLPSDPFHRSVLGGTGDPRLSVGSGVIVDAGQGYILTTGHIVASATQIVVTLKDGRRFRAELIGSEPDTGIALLKIEADDLAALPFADTNDLVVGDYVIAIGNPFGLGESVTPGIVSGLGRPGEHAGLPENLIQTSAAIASANSGGALVDLRGQLVGVNNATFAPDSGDRNAGFAVSANAAQAAMNLLVAVDTARRAGLNVRSQNATADLVNTSDPGETDGAQVIELIKGSTAEYVEVRPDDAIEAIDAGTVYGSAELESKIELFKGGDMVVLTVVDDEDSSPVRTRFQAFESRGNGPTSLIPATIRSPATRAEGGRGRGPTSLIPTAPRRHAEETTAGASSGPRSLIPSASLPQVARAEKFDGGRTKRLGASRSSLVAGAVLRDGTAGGGVLVESVEQDSPAWRDGLREADVIATVNRTVVRDTLELGSELRSADRTVVIQVRRGDAEKVVVLRR